MSQLQTHATHKLVFSPWLAGMIATGCLGLLAVLVLTPGESLLDRLRWLDSGICAQLATHSFYPGGERLPLCARNTGIYLGFFVTLISMYAFKRGRVQRLPTKPIIAILMCGIATLVIDGFNSFFLDLSLPHLYQPSNFLRLATGLITGLALAAYVLPLLNRLCWRNTNERHSIANGQELIRFVPALLMCCFAVTSQNVVALYPVAVLSTCGLLTAVSSFNFALIIVLSKRDETFGYYRQLLPLLGLALMLAIGELLALAQLKLLVLQALSV